MDGKAVELREVSMQFGQFMAVKNANLHIRAGEFFSILGPSGCGKTTILRMVSGFMDPTAGAVYIGDEDMTGIGANKRPTALIFQNLALFPLMKVWENIAFGLEVRGVSKAARRKRADELLDLIALNGQGDKLVSELSGGQRQRVAIARALAVNPSVLLLDEPLSALDLKLRQHMRAELREIQQRTGVTFIYITHDQGEALTMSDRVAVMNHGVVNQVDTPQAIYNNPATAFAATFVGENNAIFGKVSSNEQGRVTLQTPQGMIQGRCQHDLPVGSDAIAFIRPEQFQFGPAGSFSNHLSGTLKRIDLEGAYLNLFVQRQDGRDWVISAPNNGSVQLSQGQQVDFGSHAEHTLILPSGELAHE
ncbi:ABC transporter ATP-binding protein [Balneatrix alpica]|uniref:ABC transporter ATP-binding protein n=1 Tax=Balneatrix alpica TaxID=75684 RepID=A0ABV5Z889_9GAMM|nr:ABC transporter ATP-binding protein [Balneatrix alpica]